MVPAKHTKIVCTIGPSSHTPSALLALMRAGMNVARLNFSHGTHAEHAVLYTHVRAAAAKVGEPVAVLADLQGPKIRLGTMPEQGVEMKTGTSVTFSTAVDTYKGSVIPVTYKGLHTDVQVGHRILIEDGLYQVRVVAIHGKEIRAKVINGGTLFSHKGMNFPDTTLRVPALTAKDKADAVFATGIGADWLALSFVTSPDDVRALRRLVKGASKNRVPPRIMVKIEKHEAVERFEEILAEADGVMVARGDLGVEIPAEAVPVRQKAIVDLARLAGKPVVVATQMLDSMIRNPRPTRAEVSDVANAVFDHTDATMLSGETASGKYPVESVATMARIIREAEKSPYDDIAPIRPRPQALEVSVAQALKSLATGRHIDGVVASLTLAPWSERLHMAHPEVPLFLVAPNDTLAQQNNIRWGVRPIVLPGKEPKALLKKALAHLRKEGLIKAGMRLAVVLGAEHGRGFDLVEVE